TSTPSGARDPAALEARRTQARERPADPRARSLDRARIDPRARPGGARLARAGLPEERGPRPRARAQRGDRPGARARRARVAPARGRRDREPALLRDLRPP